MIASMHMRSRSYLRTGAAAAVRSFLCALAAISLSGAAPARPPDGPPRAVNTAEPFSVTIRVDAGKTIGEMKPVWRFFGCDEPNYAYMRDGKKLLGELG